MSTNLAWKKVKMNWISQVFILKWYVTRMFLRNFFETGSDVWFIQNMIVGYYRCWQSKVSSPQKKIQSLLVASWKVVISCYVGDLRSALSVYNYVLHPGRLIWNLRIRPWKRKIISPTIIFRFYVTCCQV